MDDQVQLLLVLIFTQELRYVDNFDNHIKSHFDYVLHVHVTHISQLDLWDEHFLLSMVV